MNPQNFTPVKPNKPVKKNTPNILNTLLVVILILTVLALSVVLFFLIQKKINSTPQPASSPIQTQPAPTIQESVAPKQNEQPTPTNQPTEEVNAESTDSGSLTPSATQ